MVCLVYLWRMLASMHLLGFLLADRLHMLVRICWIDQLALAACYAGN